MRLLSLMKLSMFAALLALAVPLPAHAQAAGGIVASAASFVLPFVLKLLLPTLGALIATAVTVVVAKEALGFGWIRAHTKSKDQATAVDTLEHLTETATQAVLTKVGQDVLAQKSAADIAADALETLKQAVPLDRLGALAKQVAGIGKDELVYYLTHLLTAKAGPAVAVAKNQASFAALTSRFNQAGSALQQAALPLSGAAGKVLAVPEGAMAGKTLAEVRNDVKEHGAPIAE